MTLQFNRARLHIVARSMGGDAELMSSLITTGHLAAGVTMPLMLWLAMWV
ncbi:MAG: hypothetical protein OXU62_00080 [Gammaproteobacteria bacterium]|nr:hypothetical protein [Gammaproteobacteria bacterium]